MEDAMEDGCISENLQCKVDLFSEASVHQYELARKRHFHILAITAATAFWGMMATPHLLTQAGDPAPFPQGNGGQDAASSLSWGLAGVRWSLQSF